MLAIPLTKTKARNRSVLPTHLLGSHSPFLRGRFQSLATRCPLRPPSPPELYSAQLLLTWQRRFMIPGLRNDDKWRMVEDEFVAVAHKFTAHLHAAEYQRLRERARRQNSDAIRSISRPASGLMTDGVKRRQAVLALKESQSRGIKRALSRASEAEEAGADEAPWAGTNLQELMNSPRKKLVPLTRLVSAVSGTRAAALHRQDSTSTRHSPLPHRAADRRDARNQQAGSPLTDRTAFLRAQDQVDGEDDALDRPSASTRLVQHISSASRPATAERSSRSTAPGRASAPAEGTPMHLTASAGKSVSMPTILNTNDDSDSSMETFFDRRMRERRSERRSGRKEPKRKQSQPPEVANEGNQPHQRGQRSQETNALSIPSL